MSDQTGSLVAALAAIMGELGGIAKMTAEERRKRGMGGGDDGHGVSYAYRGIDQMSSAIQPLLAAHGVVIVPRVVSNEVVELLINNRPWTESRTTVEWTIAHASGDSMIACTMGYGRDNSDKGANKAMTGAFKNLLLRLFCIGDPDEDSDGSAPQGDEIDKYVQLYDRIRAFAGTPVAEELKALATENNRRLTVKGLREDAAWHELVVAVVEQAEATTQPSK